MCINDVFFQCITVLSQQPCYSVFTWMVFIICAPRNQALCVSVAYLVSEMQTVPQRHVLLDDSRLVRSPLLERGQFRERLS